MINLFWRIVLLITTAPLWVYYKLGLGGDRRDEIRELLSEANSKLMHRKKHSDS